MTVTETGVNPIGFDNYLRAKYGFNVTRDQRLEALGRYMRDYGISKIEFET